MLLKAAVYDGALLRQLAPGDVLAGAEVAAAGGTTVSITLTAPLVSTPLLSRAPASASTDTFDTAANLIAGLIAGLGLQGIQPGTTWRQRILNSGAGAITLAVTANTGMTVTNTAIPATSFKDVLYTITNGTPVQTYSVTTTNGSATIGGLTATQLQNLTVGMVVTNAVAGLQGTTISSINYNAGTITLSSTASATNTAPVAITFSPTITVTGIGSGAL